MKFGRAKRPRSRLSAPPPSELHTKKRNFFLTLPPPPSSSLSSSDQAKGAILALKDRTGSSLQAIKKYLNVAPDKNRFLNAGLAAGVKSGVLVKNKGSYKVAQAAKKAAPKKKKVAKKKPAAKKKKATKVRGVWGLCGGGVWWAATRCCGVELRPCVVKLKTDSLPFSPFTSPLSPPAEEGRAQEEGDQEEDRDQEEEGDQEEGGTQEEGGAQEEEGDEEEEGQQEEVNASI